MEQLDTEICYRALQTRDRRFDGRLFVAVTSTSIYCRPICPARTPKPDHCRFFPTAAAAEEAGFRACLRCRPEISPETAGWRGTFNSVSRALALIAEGFLDREDGNVDALATRVGMGARQLRRLFEAHLGASPIAVAQTRRVLFAKQLIHDAPLSMAEVAMAAGFGSLRRFNDAFRLLYHRPPSELRRRTSRAASYLPHSAGVGAVALLVPYRVPYDWEAMLDYLRARAVDGMECVEHNVYRRTVSHERAQGQVAVAHAPDRQALIATIQFPSVRALHAIVTRVRHLFDVGADVKTIGVHLSKDPTLAPLIAALPGLRTPGCWDGFELAVRAVLGQQISVEAARQLANKLVLLCGDQVDHATDPRLARTFPSAQGVATADLGRIGMPESRRDTLKALAQAAVANPGLFEPSGSIEESIARLRAIRGIGPWTAQYIALRALRDPDAFPATDIGIQRGAARVSGMVPTVSQLMARAESWRPWRAYAAQYLWLADAHSPNTQRKSRETRHGK